MMQREVLMARNVSKQEFDCVAKFRHFNSTVGRTYSFQ